MQIIPNANWTFEYNFTVTEDNKIKLYLEHTIVVDPDTALDIAKETLNQFKYGNKAFDIDKFYAEICGNNQEAVNRLVANLTIKALEARNLINS